MIAVDAPALPTDATPIAAAAEMYVGLGLKPVALYGVNADGSCQCGSPDCEPRNRGKHPIDSGWQNSATLDLDVVRGRFSRHRGNIGIVVAGTSLVVIDADGEVGLGTISSWNLPDTLRAISGSGVGAHFIFRLAPSQDKSLITDRKVAPGVDVKVRGQFVAAPSGHASGGRYRWTNAAPIAELSADIFDRIKRPVHVVKPRPAQPTSNAASRARAYVDKMPPAISGQGGHAALWAVARTIVQDFGLDEVDAWNILAEYNKRCEPPWSEKELEHKLRDAFKAHTSNPKPDRPLPQRIDPAETPPPYDELDEQSSPHIRVSTPPPDWRALLLWGKPAKNGADRLISHCDNVVRILHLEPQWAGKLRCDAFRGRVIVSDPPWDEFTRAAFNDHVWTDEDDARLCNWMRRHFQGYNFDPSATDCAKAVQIVAESHAFHPVKDYLTRLVWDQEPRLSHWLSRYVGASPDDYTQNVARWWMVSAVARVLRPGCKADHVMILEGEQGIRKSSALKVLGGEWFTDTPIDMNSKDAYSAIRGVWIVELAELDSLMRVEASRAKAFFSSPVDRYRPAYGRREKEIPRQCVFAGTVNHREYLRDPTGARRFWPIACTKVDLDGLTTARDQLWAEAVWLFNNGARWWPEAEENEAIRDVQEEHGEQDAWTDSVREYLMRRREVSMGDILGGALGLEKLHWTRANETRVGAIMAVLGWRRVRRQMPDGTRPRFYIGPTEKHEVGQ